MLETHRDALQGPVTLAELKSDRARFAVLFFAIILASAWPLFLAGRLVVSEGEPNTGLALALALIPQLGLSILTGVFAGRVGMKRPWLIGLLAFPGLLAWVAFFLVIGFVPERFRAEAMAADRTPAWTRWVAFAGLWPLGLAGCLLMLNPDYMLKLFLGPPWIVVGVVPCGWPILGIMLILVAAATGAQWLGFWKGKVRGGWLLLLLVLVHAFFLYPAAYLVLLGPAAIQVFEQFGFGM